MLNNSYTLGTSGNAAAYLKQYDTEANSFFAVSGLAVNAAQRLIVGHEKSNSNKLVGDKVELTFNRAVPGSTTGEVRVDRAMFVLKRAEFTSLTDYLNAAERLKTLLSDTAFLTKMYDGEL